MSTIRTLTATLLVAGTCIGAGMLALPVATFNMGFFPSLAILAFCWLFMTFTALLLAEATLWLPEGAHYISLSEKLIGPWAKSLSWILYLFIAYASLVAYTAEGGILLQIFCRYVGGGHISRPAALACFSAFFGIFLLTSRRLLGVVNTALVAGLIASYLFLVQRGTGQIKAEWLQPMHWEKTYTAIPMMLTVFSFQSIVPSLASYLRRNGPALRTSIIYGTTLAFAIYAVWQAIVMGSVPAYGPDSLQQALLEGKSAASVMRNSVRDPWISTLTEFFSFFAIVSSFLGIALGLFDFLADGLKIPDKQPGPRIGLMLAVVIPSLICAILYPRVFFTALENTGAFGDSILNGIMPVMMVWNGRYYQNLAATHRVPGGKFVLIFIVLFACIAIATGL